VDGPWSMKWSMRHGVGECSKCGHDRIVGDEGLAHDVTMADPRDLAPVLPRACEA
jgi:hypothetical protein